MSRKALVVGIDHYNYVPLSGCVNDAVAIANLVESNDDESPNFSTILKTDISKKEDLLALIRELFAGSHDVALLYFSGHGQCDDLDSYLVTPDCSADNYGVPMETILKLANSSRIKDKVIILDCCFSGAMGSPKIFGGDKSHISEGVTILTSSKKDEPSVEFGGHGLFTALLIEALKGGAADICGNITSGSVYSYIDKALGPWTQRPLFITNVSRFLALRETYPLVPLETLREIAKYFPEPDEEFALDPSFEDTNTPEVIHEIKKPYADPINVPIFKNLQKFVSLGLVEPVGADHMYYAAIESKSCKLTTLGKHYWYLVAEKMI